MIRKKLHSLIAGILVLSTMFVSVSSKVYADTDISAVSNIQNEGSVNYNTRSVNIGTVTARSGLNMRTSASASASVKVVIPYGSKVNIQSSASGWHYVEYNGSYGYVSAEYVSLSASNGTSSSTTAESGVVTASSGLNMRVSASTTSDIKKVLPYGTTVKIKSSMSGWYYIEHNGDSGYVSSSYISLNGSSSVSGSGTGSSSAGGSNSDTINVGTVTASNGLNMRECGSTTAPIKKVLPYGTKVNIKKSYSEWYYVEHNGTYGYVSSSYISLNGSSSGSGSGSSSAGESNSDTINVGVITASNGLNMRESGSTTAPIKKVLPYGTKVNIKKSYSEWYYVEHNGTYGYVSRSYVQIESSGSTSSSSESSADTYSRLLNVLRAQVGTPYVYGGSGEYITEASINSLRNRFPEANAKGWYDKIESKYYNGKYRAFDCSGLVQWAFGQVGINISRTTYTQINDGVSVAVSAAKPGDLLFYTDKSHVGVYIGNNKWIESPYSGEYVREVSVPWNKIGYAKRILK